MIAPAAAPGANIDTRVRGAGRRRRGRHTERLGGPSARLHRRPRRRAPRCSMPSRACPTCGPRASRSAVRPRRRSTPTASSPRISPTSRCCGFAGDDAKPMVEKLTAAKLNLEWQPASSGASAAAIFQWLAQHKREAFPLSIDCETNSPTFARCYWIQPTKFDANERNDVLPSTRIPGGTGAVARSRRLRLQDGRSRTRRARHVPARKIQRAAQVRRPVDRAGWQAARRRAPVSGHRWRRSPTRSRR